MSVSLFSKRITLLFSASFLFLSLHILDDAFVVNEAAWYGITTAEFLFGCILLYGIAPPYGLWLARRNSGWGFAILTLYALQAFYGAGLNHVRHLFGDFGGSQLLPKLLNGLGIFIGEFNGQGLVSLFAGMLGLNTGVPPHTHTLISNVIVFLSMGVNLVLLGFLAIALWQKIFARKRILTDGKSA